MPPDSQRRNNRIEVDLNILKNDELKRLREFGEQFAGSITQLANTLGGYGTQVRTHAQNVNRNSSFDRLANSGPIYGPNGRVLSVGGGSLTAAHGPEDTIQSKAQQRERTTEQFKSARESLNTLRAQNGLGRTRSYAPAALSQIERAQFSLGTFGEPTLLNTLQQMSYRSGALAYGTDDQGNPTLKSKTMARASEGFGQGADTLLGIQQGVMPLINSAANFNGARRYNGAQQLGYDTAGASWWSGLPGAGFFTEGGRQSIAQRWTNNMASLSLGWSKEEQQNLTSSLANRGVDTSKSFLGLGSNRGRSDISDSLQRIIRETGIDPDTVVEQWDRARRYDPGSLSHFEEDMKDLQKSAKAAGMGVDQFAKAALDAATQMSESMGMSGSDARRAITAGAAGGLVPDQVSRLTNQGLALRTMANNPGMQYSEVMDNPSLNLDQVYKEVQGVSGISMSEMQKAKKRAESPNRTAADVQRYDAMRSQMDILYQDPTTRDQIFQGMTPDQLLTFSDSKQRSRMDLSYKLQEAIKPGRLGNIKDSDLQKMMKESGFSSKDISSVEGSKDKWHRAEDILNKKTGNKMAGPKLKVELSRQAKKLLDVSPKSIDLSFSNASKFVGQSLSFNTYQPDYGTH
jgi:hypothetical protein